MEYNVEVPYAQVMDARQATRVPVGDDKAKIFTIDHPCTEVKNNPKNVADAYNGFAVRGAVYAALGYKVSEQLGQYDVSEFVRNNTSIYVTTPPKHGSIVQISEGARKAGVYNYKGNGSYIGKDTFVINIDTFSKKGKKVSFQLKFNVSVVENITNENDTSTCVGMKFSSLTSSPLPFVWNSLNTFGFATLGASSFGKTIGQGLPPKKSPSTSTLEFTAGSFMTPPDNNGEFLSIADLDRKRSYWYGALYSAKRN